MNNKYVQQFKKGSLEMILLCLIGRKETYGYEIITELNNSASVLGYAKEGTIYHILYRLQEAELIKCRLAPARQAGQTSHSSDSQGKLPVPTSGAASKLYLWRRDE